MLEELAYLIRDTRVNVALGQIKQLGTTLPTGLLVEVAFLPDEYRVVAMVAKQTIGWADPKVGDVVVVVLPDKESEYATVIAVIPGDDRQLHDRAQAGETVIGAVSGRKTNIISNVKINLDRGSGEASEALVLGEVLQTYLGEVTTKLESIVDHLITIAAGLSVTATAAGDSTTASSMATLSTTALPAFRLLVTMDKTIYLDTPATNILSQIAFTER